MNKTRRKHHILVIGGGRRGLATIEVLNDDPTVEIVAVVDIDPNSAGIRLAKRLDIDTSDNYQKYLTEESYPDAVLNLTDDEQLEKDIVRLSSEYGFELLGEVTKRVLGNLLVERQVQTELHRVSKRMTSGITLPELLVLILSSCIKSTKAGGGMILLKNEETGDYEVESSLKLSSVAELILKEEVQRQLPQWLKSNEAMPLIEDSSLMENIPAELKTALCAPLRSRDRITGALIIVKSSEHERFSGGSRRLLSTFANQSTVAIENILLYQKFQHQSVTDGLTGLYNHRYFKEQIEIELGRAQRYDHSLSILFVDLDNFKEINDTYGHQTGNDMLRKISHFIKQAVRLTDTVFRYGGDEFVVILPETHKEGALIVGERIRKGMAENVISAENPVNVSLGLSTYPEDGVFGPDLIKKADSALYKAKEGGRNRICAA